MLFRFRSNLRSLVCFTGKHVNLCLSSCSVSIWWRSFDDDRKYPIPGRSDSAEEETYAALVCAAHPDFFRDIFALQPTCITSRFTIRRRNPRQCTGVFSTLMWPPPEHFNLGWRDVSSGLLNIYLCIEVETARRFAPVLIVSWMLVNYVKN